MLKYYYINVPFIKFKLLIYFFDNDEIFFLKTGKGKFKDFFNA